MKRKRNRNQNRLKKGLNSFRNEVTRITGIDKRLLGYIVKSTVIILIFLFCLRISEWLGLISLLGSAIGVFYYARIRRRWNRSPPSKGAPSKSRRPLDKCTKQIKATTVKLRWKDAEFAYKTKNPYMFLNTAGVAIEKAVLYAYRKRNGKKKKTSTRGAIDHLIKHKYFSLPPKNILRAWRYRNQYAHESGINGKSAKNVDDKVLRQLYTVTKHVVDCCLSK